MRTIGLIGGMSAEASAKYYVLINESVRERLGGSANARSVMLTVSFPEVEALEGEGDWALLGAMMVSCARALESAGADCVVMCANTIHKVAPSIEGALSIPLLHIVDVTAEAVRRAGVSRVGLLGSRFTMGDPFWAERARAVGGLEVLVPDAAGRAEVDRVISEELVRGIVREESRAALRTVMRGLVERGAEGIVLGCTEFGMLLGEGDAEVPMWDTLRLHAQAAADWALA